MTTVNRNNKISFYSEENKSNSLLKSVVISALFSLLFAMEIAAPVLYGSLGGAYELSIGTGVAALIAAAVGVAVPVVIFRIFEKNHKKRIIALAAIIVLVALVAAIFNKLIKTGALVYINCVLGNQNTKNGSVVAFFDTEGTQLTAGIILLLLCVALVWTIVTMCILNFRQVIVLMIISFIFLVGEVLAVPSFPVWAAIATGLLIILLVVSNGAVKEVFSGKWVLIVITVLVAAVIAVAVFAFSSLPKEGIKSVQKSLINSVENTVMGKSDLTDGDFTNVGNKNTSEDTRLEVSGISGDIYLRGFTGAEYTGNGFQDLDKEAYENENLQMYQWFSETDEDSDYTYSPITGLSYALSNAVEDDVSSAQITIKNTGASTKYIYVPYGISSLNGDYLNKDLNVKNSIVSQVKDYSVQTQILEMDYDTRDSFVLLSLKEDWQDKDYLSNNHKYYATREQKYNQYVETYYCSITQELADYLDSLNLDKGSTESDYWVTSYIRSYLNSIITYSETPKTTFGNDDAESDYIVNLLKNDREGYDVQYAAAATVLYRYYGIPARYVEGYIKSGSSNVVTASDAHAWVEIYRSGIGWVPVETTPGYYKAITPQSEGEDDGNKVQDDSDAVVIVIEEDTKDYNRLILLLIIPAIVILAAIVLAVRRWIILFIRKKKIEGRDYKLAISVMAGLIVKNSSLAGVALREDFPTEDSEKMDTVFGKNGKQFRPVALAIAHAFYRSSGASKNDVKVVKQYWLSSINTLYEGSKELQELKLKFIDVIS